MSINLTDEIEVKTKKGKLGAAKQIFLEGDTQTVEKEIQDINSRHNTLNTKHESLSRTVQGIAATGGANTATNVTYNNDISGLNAENAQDAIDEVSSIAHFAKKGGVVNISTNYNSDHIVEVLTLSQALSKVPMTDRVLGFQGKYLATDGWHTIIYTGNSLTDWGDTTKWTDLADKVFNSISKNATFAGIATPTTNPGKPDGPVFYIATTSGSYSNFNNIEVLKGETVILQWNSGTWAKSAFKPMTDFNSVFDDNGNSLTHKLNTLDSNISELEEEIDSFHSCVESSEFSEVKIDVEGKILESRDTKGNLTFYTNIHAPNIPTTEQVEQSLNEFESELYKIKGKKIACFGDSIMEFKYQGKGIVEHLCEIGKCKTFRCAFGGSRYVSRGTQTLSPSNETEARVALDLENLVHSIRTKDWSYLDASIEWFKKNDASHAYYADIAEIIKSVDFSDIDYAVVLSGTNDWYAGVPVDDIKASIDNIVEEFLSLNANIKILFVSSPVRYINNDRTEKYWSSNWKNPNGKTLPYYINEIASKCLELNIPFNDIYHSLGINENNFSNYFLDTDGTHPYKAFRYIANSICEFIVKPVAIDTQSTIKRFAEIQEGLYGYNKENKNYIRVVTDSENKILYGVDNQGRFVIPQLSPNSNLYTRYNKLIKAIEDGNVKDIHLGSIIIHANTEKYDTDFGEGDTYDNDKVNGQFNFPSNVILPKRQKGFIQSVFIDGVKATIYSLGDNWIFCYAKNKRYRVAYNNNVDILNADNTTIQQIVYPAFSDAPEGAVLRRIYETSDKGMLFEVGVAQYGQQYIYKANITNVENNVVEVTCHKVFTTTNGETNRGTTIWQDWSIKQYGERILISPYGFGRTAQIWMSTDFGETFSCILNLVRDDTFVVTKPSGTSFGANGIHPIPSALVPAQPDDFWDSPSRFSNGNIHIHSVCYDEYFGRIWWVGGDDKLAATGIYWSDDEGKTWHRRNLLNESGDADLCPQEKSMQMLQVIALPNCVLFGSDGWGSGIFRYNRVLKAEVPELDYAFSWGESHSDLFAVAQSAITISNGIALMSFAPNKGSNPVYYPNGGVVATDGYRYKRILIDSWNEGNAETIKLHWHNQMVVENNNFHIMCTNSNELITIKNLL